MALLERDGVLERLEGLLDQAAGGSGRLALIRGEAGIGKTSVVRAFVDQSSDHAHVLWGVCDDLLTARPLGPVWDMVFDEPSLEEALVSGDRQASFRELYELLSRGLRPTVVVIEDVHWADDATIDLIKFLGRRIDRTHGLVILTYRDGEVHTDHPLRVALGDLGHGMVDRIALEPLSTTAIVELVGDEARAQELWELTGGNPFFVNELIEGEEDRVPVSIRDVVTARVLRLSPAGRVLIELVSVIPGRTEIDLAEELLGDVADAIDQCEEAGLLEVQGNAISFRHELARRAVEGELSESHRRSLNLDVLNALERMGADLTRRAHHAREAEAPDAIVRLLPKAARRAAKLGSHREAVSHLRALEPYLNHMSDEELADHYDLWAYEEYHATSEGGEGIIDKAVALRREHGDPTRLGRSLLMASRIAWLHSRRPAAVELAREAKEVLKAVGGPDLAMAFSNLSQLAMLASDEEATIKYAEAAIACGGSERYRAHAHALNNIGAVRMMGHYPDGISELEESYRLSRDLGLTDDVVRAAINLAWGYLFSPALDKAGEWLETGLAIVDEVDMPTSESYFLAESAFLECFRGRFDEAERKAQTVMERSAAPQTSLIVASTVLAKVHVRRGAPEAKHSVLDAWKRAADTDEPIRMAPAGSVVAEYAWLGGSVSSSVISDMIGALRLTLDRGVQWMGGDLAQWLWLGGAIDEMPQGVAEPFTMLAAGRWREAADHWRAAERPYEQALALSRGDEESMIEALGILDALGAGPLASSIRSELQSAGVRRIPRGPQRAARSSPLGLTPRQTEVLELLGEGLTNAEIADRLFVSTRTVDHHVSAVLAKLGADTRSEAVRRAQERASA